MSIKYCIHCISVFACAAMPVIAAAQEKNLSNPAEPNVAATLFHYKSVFQDYQPLAESDEAPDKVWRAANDEVGRIGGHAGIMRVPNGSAANESGSTNAPAAPASGVHRHGHGTHH